MVSQLFHTCHSILLQQFVVRTIQCGTNHSAVFCAMIGCTHVTEYCAVIGRTHVTECCAVIGRTHVTECCAVIGPALYNVGQQTAVR